MDAGVGAQRSVGAVKLAVRQQAGRTVLERLHQAGALRLRMVRAEQDGFATAILLNTGGGVAGGDDYRVDLDVGAEARLVISSQGAERIYRAGVIDAPARIELRVMVAARAMMEWLPQETILSDQAAMARRMRVDLDITSRYLGIDALVFGRAAMGERVHFLDFSDRVEIHRDGRLVYMDRLRPPADFTYAQERAAMLGGATAMATVILAEPDAERWLEPVRAVLGNAQAGASSWNQLLIVRMLAPSGEALRYEVQRVLTVLREGRAMPRVWAC